MTFELRRVGALSTYAFAVINDLKLELTRGGEQVIDLGFGNPTCRRSSPWSRSCARRC